MKTQNKMIEVQRKKERTQLLSEKQQSEYLYGRYLHNELLEAKGKIRVFCRIRPFIPSDVQIYANRLERQSLKPKMY